jgi:tetratricopeptide (TPR) repeat protein
MIRTAEYSKSVFDSSTPIHQGNRRNLSLVINTAFACCRNVVIMLKSISRKKPVFLLILSCLLLSACANTMTQTQTPGKHETLYRDATKALTEGNQDKAIQLLDESSRADPTYADPWVKMAQIYFDSSNYPMAIKAADEATKRDPARRETKAIAVVASLRVAIQALGEMREDSGLRGNTREEAERLARTLRETLSIDQILPAAPAAAPTNKNSAPPPATPAAKPAPAPRAPARKSGASDASGAANPFQVLKK